MFDSELWPKALMIGNQFMLSFFAAGMKGGDVSELSVTAERAREATPRAKVGLPVAQTRSDLVGGRPGDGGES